MNKIPTMFERDEKTFRVTPVCKPECLWVLNGEGIATKKWDGTCCMVKDGKLFKRYDGSKSKYLPPDFVPHENAESHWFGWRPVGQGPEDRWHMEAWKNTAEVLPNGTYELVGPSVNKNPEKLMQHAFRRHGDVVCENVPRTLEGLKEWLADKDIEGIVFHHPDGRMAKIKKRDFGMKR
jgi:hypothetical protein